MSLTAIIGDIHGESRKLTKLLVNFQISGVERIISLGDITDKGDDAIGSIELLKAHGAELVSSNHDQRYVEALRKNKDPDSFMPKSKSIDAPKLKALYREIYDHPFAGDYLKSAKPSISFDVQGHKVTCVHGGVSPTMDLNKLSGKEFNELIRLRHLDPETYDMVKLVRVNGEYPDEEPEFKPENENVVMWQNVYDGRFGTIIHGHQIFQTPKLWPEQLYYNELLIKNYKVISIDTGAFKGGPLTSLVVDNENGRFYFYGVY